MLFSEFFPASQDDLVRETAELGRPWTERERAYFQRELTRRTLDAMAEFAAGAGHEINNPLAIVDGRAQELLKESAIPERFRRQIASMGEQARRAYEMIADVRAFARPPKPELKSISARAFFDAWVERERKRAENREKNARIEIDFNGFVDNLTKLDASNAVSSSREGESSSESDVSALGEGVSATFESDPATLATVLDALGKNAVEAIDVGGRIRLSCEIVAEPFPIDDAKPRRALAFAVEDDGPGVAPEIRRLVFSPFFSGRQAGRGLGFGLSKAWRFAQTLNASVFCDAPTRWGGGCRWGVALTLDVGAEGENSAESNEING